MQLRRINQTLASLYKPLSLFTGLMQASDERTTIVKRNVVFLVALKGLSAAANILLVPITLEYLDATNYGVWLTLSSIIGWVSFLDIGLGSGLRNKFAEAIAKGERGLAKSYVSSTYAFLFLTIIVAFVAIGIVSRIVQWSTILNVMPSMEHELRMLVTILAGMFLLRIVSGLVGYLLLATQSAALSSSIDVATSVVTLGAVYLLTRTTERSLLYLGMTISLIFAVVPLIFSVWMFRTRLSEFVPSLATVRLRYARMLVGVGFQFFVLQAMFLVVFSTSNVIITQMFQPDEVTKYNVAFKYYSVPSMAFSVLLIPFWSAYTDAFHRGELSWIRNSLWKLVWAWLVLGVVVVLMTLGSDFFYRLWVGDSIKIPLIMSILMGVYALMTSWCNMFVSFLNGVGKIRLQLYVALAAGAISIPLAIYFSRSLGIRSGGVILAICLCLLPLCFLWPMQTHRILLRVDTGIWGK